MSVDSSSGIRVYRGKSLASSAPCGSDGACSIDPAFGIKIFGVIKNKICYG